MMILYVIEFDILPAAPGQSSYIGCKLHHNKISYLFLGEVSLVKSVDSDSRRLD